MSGNKNTGNVLQVDVARIRNEACGVRGCPIEVNDVIRLFVPAGLENSRGQYYIGAAVVVQHDIMWIDGVDLSNIERAVDIIADGDEFTREKILAVKLVVLSVGIFFGLSGAISGNI